MFRRVSGLEKGMATHSSILGWRTPWTEEPGGPWSIGSQKWLSMMLSYCWYKQADLQHVVGRIIRWPPCSVSLRVPLVNMLWVISFPGVWGKPVTMISVPWISFFFTIYIFYQLYRIFVAARGFLQLQDHQESSRVGHC